MKKQFSATWKASSQPRKQRKYLAKAPLHIKKKQLGVNLSKDLRKKHGKRSTIVRKGDIVKIMRGKFNKKQGKVLEVRTMKSQIIIEGIQVKKIEGSKVGVPIKPSNLQIIELNLEDKKRNQKLSKKEEGKTETKDIKKVKVGPKEDKPKKTETKSNKLNTNKK
ncbi:MAG: 50S ribosomal protein L24 [Nanoarchaeota archaeon]|nr:50S ribosomal protein L24 [Nanoarchaeota archaeon]